MPLSPFEKKKLTITMAITITITMATDEFHGKLFKLITPKSKHTKRVKALVQLPDLSVKDNVDVAQ